MPDLQSTNRVALAKVRETTFAVTQTPIGLPPTVVAVDRTSLARGKVEPVTDGVPARICVSSGKPIEGCEVRIVDENRFDVAPGSVGEIAITSATMFSGYRNYPEKTAEVLCDGWYYSGDYGFQDDGELFVERSESEAFLFDDGRLKSAAFDATEGFGLRVVAGETAG